jgi:outer membrane protein assembly factor BamB
MYLGNLAHTSSAAGETQITPANAAHLRQLWKTNVGSLIASGVTVSGGSLYFGAWDGNFYSVNAVTGKIQWTAFLGMAPEPPDSACQPGIGISSQAVVSGDTLYVGGGDSAVYALDRNTGQVRWRVPVADPQSGAYLWSSVMLSRNSLYIGIASLGDCPLVRGGLARVPLDDPFTPLVRYFVLEGAVGAGVWSTPALDEAAGIVYVTTGNADQQDAANGVWGSALLALDAASLETKGHFFLPAPLEGDADWGSSPMLFQTADGGQYVAANGKNGYIYALRRSDLSVAWSFQMAANCDTPQAGCGSLSTPAFDGTVLVSGAGQPPDQADALGSVYAFDPVSGDRLWSYAGRGVVIAPVTLVPGLVLAPADNGLVILDAASGARLWTDAPNPGLYGQAVVSDGVIYATYVNGDVVAWAVPGTPGGGAVNGRRTFPRPTVPIVPDPLRGQH